MFTTERMGQWMLARDQRYIVLRVADVLTMRDNPRRILAQFASIDERTDPREAWKSAGAELSGYVRVGVAALVTLDRDGLIALQAALSEYAQGRMSRGTPVRRDTCEKCQGRGCNECGGRGFTETLIEMDEHETRLAAGEEGATHGTEELR